MVYNGINVTHANYSGKRKYEIYFVIDIYEKLNLLGYMNLPLPVKMGP